MCIFGKLWLAVQGWVNMNCRANVVSGEVLPGLYSIRLLVIDFAPGLARCPPCPIPRPKAAESAGARA